MKQTLENLAELLGGKPDSALGNPEITGIASLSEAVPGDISFLSEVGDKLRNIHELEKTRASAVIASEKAKDLKIPSIRFSNPYIGFARALEFFRPEFRPRPGIHPTAFVDESADVHPTAIIGAMAVIEANVTIGEKARIDSGVVVERSASIGMNTRICSNVTVRNDCVVGINCIIHSGSVIGSDGFGFTKTSEGHLKISQTGNVIIGNDVEIGANVTIDRATMGSTTVGDGTKIDNLVHLAHNVKVGKRCLIIAQTGISGSTVIGDDVTMAGQTGTVGHVTVGKNCVIAARGVVTENLPDGSVVSGFPCKPHNEEKRIMASLRRLPDLMKRLRELEVRVERSSNEK
ncbi:MAG: UDP-3-O-(3-hydroxymyristoyl)glucosamine N-acyltransferase [Candidatus Riflebacteria bacterium]|nr:UDP-3-O-(3-hydroxymyristoyl)glucosamine N-acyltransferase [Candidatus Riflebacteria bacterium]